MYNLKFTSQFAEWMLMFAWWIQNLWEGMVDKTHTCVARIKTWTFQDYIPVLMSYDAKTRNVNLVYNKDNWFDVLYIIVFRWVFRLEPPMFRLDEKTELDKIGNVLVYCTYCLKNAHRVYHVSFGEEPGNTTEASQPGDATAAIQPGNTTEASQPGDATEARTHIECERHTQHQDVAFITTGDMRNKFDISYLYNTIGKMMMSKGLPVTPVVLADIAATMFPHIRGLGDFIHSGGDYELYVINFDNPVWSVYKRDVELRI